MNKQEIIKQYQKEEDKLLVSKILDKIQFTTTRNQIQITDFLDGYEQKIAQKLLIQIKYQNYLFYGGHEEAERKVIFFFPEKLESFFYSYNKENYNIIKNDSMKESGIIEEYIKVISIALPSDLKGEYHHRDYLSGIMKLGIKREKVGDILVREDGADILALEEISSYLLSNLQELTRFKKSNIIIKEISQLQKVSIKKESIEIVVSTLRLDSIVSELAHTSRSKAEELILKERVLVNYETKTKNSIMLKQGDLLTIRGKGKFQIGEVVNQTSKGKVRLLIEKYSS